LAGPVESEAARDELERVASSVPGVVEVDNRLVAPVDTDA
jgi:osmotically-inducible protein OsmY